MYSFEMFLLFQFHISFQKVFILLNILFLVQLDFLIYVLIAY